MLNKNYAEIEGHLDGNPEIKKLQAVEHIAPHILGPFGERE